VAALKNEYPIPILRVIAMKPKIVIRRSVLSHFSFGNTKVNQTKNTGTYEYAKEKISLISTPELKFGKI
jgi:hypothetical protein